MRKIYFLFILLLSLPLLSFAQGSKTSLVKGKLVYKQSKAPVFEVRVSLMELGAFTSSDGDGNFSLSEVPFGKQTLIISGSGAKRDTIVINVVGELTDLGDVSVNLDENGVLPNPAGIPTVVVDENSSESTEQDGASSTNPGGVTFATRDPFMRTATYTFGNYHFQTRGLKRATQDVEINGVSINDAETGSSAWNSTGGLSDVFRGRNVTYGLGPSDFMYGGLSGSTYVEASAADQREGNNATYTISNRSWRNRVMFTKSSGINKKGWATSFSFSKRWADEGYVPGTFYDGYSYYAAVSKVTKKGQFNLTTFGSPTKRGKLGAATMEADSLAGSHYFNHAWGYMPNGTKRNSATSNVFTPTTIFNYEYRPSDDTRWNFAAGYEFGKTRNGSLNDYNAPLDVIGDYYKNMPSYFDTYFPPQHNIAQAVRTQLATHPQQLQLDWTRIYQDNYINTETYNNINGTNQSITGKRSLFVLSDNVDAVRKLTLNTTVEHSVNEQLEVFGGLSFVTQRDEIYKQLTDLLGGDFFVNFNQFASQQYVGNPNYNQNNLLDPNAIIRKGDKWGEDYAIKFYNTNAWGQAVYTKNRYNMFVAATIGNNAFNREGFMKNGLFANNSYGTSATHSFLTYGIKGGLSYNVDVHNMLFLNGNISTSAPTAANTYISAGTRDFAVDNPQVQQNLSVEGGYIMKSPLGSLRIVGYATDIRNATEIKRFFNDDPAFYTFTNYVMQGENTRSLGTEIALEAKVTKSLNVIFVAAIGQAFYSNRPNINVYLDNDTLQHAVADKAYIKNYYMAVGPQTAGTIGFNYRPLRDMAINLNFNYFDRNYVEINPNRRTPQAADLVVAGSQEWHAIFDQEKLPSVFTVDLTARKTWQLSRMSKSINKFSHNTALSVNAGVSNLLNNTNIINTGFEQLRYDFANINSAKFANKYIYGMGINFIVNVSLRF